MRLDRSLNLLLIGEIEPALRLTLRAALITRLAEISVGNSPWCDFTQTGDRPWRRIREKASNQMLWSRNWWKPGAKTRSHSRASSARRSVRVTFGYSRDLTICREASRSLKATSSQLS